MIIQGQATTLAIISTKLAVTNVKHVIILNIIKGLMKSRLMLAAVHNPINTADDNLLDILQNTENAEL